MAADKLTDKQLLFVKEYLIDLNGSAAYLRAGYKCKENVARVNACNLLTNPNISEAIQKAMDKRAKAIELTAHGVLSDIKTIKERCMQGVMVLTREGNPTGEWKFDATNALKACELEGKHLKLFTDKTEVSGPDGGPISINFEGKLDEWSR